jgi:hypothetical protein
VSLPEIPGLLTQSDILATAHSIAEVQEPSGAIPWFPEGHTDPWDHVESAMALDVAGLHDVAARAYGWLQRTQRSDGAWLARYERGHAAASFVDVNFCGYIAVGVWHHFRTTGQRAALGELWPTVRRALDFVVAHQLAGGEIAWASDHKGPVSEALLTSSSSLYHSLRAGLAIAQELGEPLPDWELATGRLGHALRRHPERFEDKARWSMDWYYPVLGGAVRGRDAEVRIAQRWDEFWVEGLGLRCVADRPWVTGAETCELALTLDAIGARDAALEALTAMQHLRDPDGSYWTGYVFEDGKRWPVERSTWTGAAVILAADAISETTPGASVFRGDELPLGVDPISVVCSSDLDAEAAGSVPACDSAQQA